MEFQQPEVLGFGATPWKTDISVDDSSAALRRGGRGRVLCFEADKMKKNNVAYKYKRASSEEAHHDSNSSSSSSISMLLVWSGQPNEDDDDNQPRKLHKPSNCTSFINLNLSKDEGEGPKNDGVVGWPPVKTWRKKLLHQHYAPQQPQMNARRRSQEQGKWNIKHVLEN